MESGGTAFGLVPSINYPVENEDRSSDREPVGSSVVTREGMGCIYEVNSCGLPVSGGRCCFIVASHKLLLKLVVVLIGP